MVVIDINSVSNAFAGSSLRFASFFAEVWPISVIAGVRFNFSTKSAMPNWEFQFKLIEEKNIPIKFCELKFVYNYKTKKTELTGVLGLQLNVLINCNRRQCFQCTRFWCIDYFII